MWFWWNRHDNGFATSWAHDIDRRCNSDPVVADYIPDIGTEHYQSESTSNQILLLGDVLIRSNKNVKCGGFGCIKKLTVLDPG